MNRKQYWSMLMLAVGAAFASGAASGNLLVTQPVEAQREAPKTNVLIVPEGGLVFKTPEGKTIVRMEGGGAGGHFGLYSSTGEAVAIMGVDANGGGFAVYNNQGKTMGSMAATPKGGVIGLFDMREKVLWQAP